LFSTPKAGLVRYITCKIPSPRLLESEKLHLLLVSARPVDPLLQRLPGTEKATISAALVDSLRADSIQVNVLPRADRFKTTWDLLNEWLINNKGENAPHIFHFDGHGGYGKLCKCGTLNRAVADHCWLCDCTLISNAEGFLAFEKTDSGTEWISAHKLSNLLSGAGVRLAVLSACKSAVMSGKSVFNGMAPALIQARIPAVVAMQYSIAAEAAEKFIKAFYQSLSNGDSLVSAINQARAGLFVDQTAWYRPVLYLRTDESNPDGKLLSGDRRNISGETPNTGSKKGISSGYPPDLLSSGVFIENSNVNVGEDMFGGNKTNINYYSGHASFQGQIDNRNDIVFELQRLCEALNEMAEREEIEEDEAILASAQIEVAINKAKKPEADPVKIIHYLKLAKEIIEEATARTEASAELLTALTKAIEVIRQFT
jgi:CHAT domain